MHQTTHTMRVIDEPSAVDDLRITSSKICSDATVEWGYKQMHRICMTYIRPVVLFASVSCYPTQTQANCVNYLKKKKKTSKRRCTDITKWQLQNDIKAAMQNGNCLWSQRLLQKWKKEPINLPVVFSSTIPAGNVTNSAKFVHWRRFLN